VALSAQAPHCRIGTIDERDTVAVKQQASTGRTTDDART
jgi:hypothetical protein